MEFGGVSIPARYLLGLAATVIAVIVLAVSGGSKESKPVVARSSTSTASTAKKPNNAPISIRPLPSTTIVIQSGWVKKGTSQYADPSDDRSSELTITTLPASSTSQSTSTANDSGNN